MVPNLRFLRIVSGFWAGPPCKVGRILYEGDEVAGFRVIHAPGHTPGHVIYFRESDRVAIAGDVLANIHFITGREGLREPPAAFSADAELNRQSIRKLVSLRPAVVCFGHGPPLRSLERLEEFVAKRLGTTKREA
jgi:glyoxylase-like metal-dependent hydrolase (beta-lactamase superfamily II)